MHFKEKENYDKATEYFRKALERGHEPMKCYIQLLDVYLLRIDRSTERPITDLPREGLGMVILNEVRQTYGGTPSEIYLLFGLRYCANSKEFEKAIKLEPDDPEPYYGMGKIYYRTAKQNEKYVRKAVFYFEKYLYLGGEKEKEVRELLEFLK